MLRLTVLSMVVVACAAVSARCIHAQVAESDSLALVNLYDATNGADWTYPSPVVRRWLDGPVPLWYGVLVRNKRVIFLDLRSRNLDGELPDLSELDELEGLNLLNNKLVGPFPDFVFSLNKMRVLNLRLNQFSGEIPSDISLLTELDILSLGSNAFSGEIPPEIGWLSNLTSLNLEDNQFEGAIPYELGDLGALLFLFLSDNALDGQVPAELTNLESAESIHLSNNQLTELPTLTAPPSWLSLYLDNNRFTFEDFERNIDLFNATPTIMTPQANVKAVDDGAGTLSVTVGGQHNVYEWFWDDPNTPDPDFTWLPNGNSAWFTPVESGDYYVRITNSLLNTSLNPNYPTVELFSDTVSATVLSGDFVVNSDADSPDGDPVDQVCDTGSSGGGLTGLCTLRAAIETANALANGKRLQQRVRITFDISGEGIPTIRPTSAFPDIRVSVELNGTTQAPEQRVEISGDLAGANIGGLVIEGGESLISGLAINRFLGNGLVLKTKGENVVENNFIGTTTNGLEPAGNGAHGVWIDNVSLNRIGGAEDVQRNVISANVGHGILVSGQNAFTNFIENNYIGTTATGERALGNAANGILIDGAQLTQIGELDAPVPGADRRNLISGNDGSGIGVRGADAIGNTFRINRIYDNGVLDIDLGADRVTPNDLSNLTDNMDADDGPNGLINFPVGVTGFQEPSSVFRISGVVNTDTPTSVTVDVYSSDNPNPLGYGGGQTWLGEATPDSAGVFFLELVDAPDAPFLSALATDADGSTSEFSPVCGDPDGDGNPDTDGDGLCDDWESAKGLDYDGDGNTDLDLAVMGAKPDRKDLFLEVDWMKDAEHSHEPDALGLVMVKEAFAAAPVLNRDGSMGVSIHILKDESVPEVNPIRFNRARAVKVPPAGLFDDLKLGRPVNPCGEADNDGHFGTMDDRKSDRCGAILGARRLVYRYVIFGHDHAHNPGSSGIGELPGNDFMVTVNWGKNIFLNSAGFGRPANADALLPIAKRRVEAATLMHEMGHTLNRRHGGVDNENCKPNYPSIMSYALQFQSLIPRRPLDYSGVRMDDLDENLLDETKGLDGPADRFVVYNSSQGDVGDPDNLDVFEAKTNQKPIDWDGLDKDGDGNQFNDNPSVSDINFVKQSCRNPGLSVLRGSHDWVNIRPNFRSGRDWADGVARQIPESEPVPELTPDDIIDMAENFDFDGDEIMNAFDNCSAIANPGQEDVDRDGIGDVCEMAAADLGVTVRASPDPGVRFADLTYTMTVHNLGPDMATDVSVALNMDDAMTYLSSIGDACTTIDRVIGCSAGDIIAGDSVMVTAIVQPTEMKTLAVTATTSSFELDPLPDNNIVANQTDVTTSVGISDEAAVPEKFGLGPVYPNPFNSTVTIPFDVAQNTHVTLVVYNVLGQRVGVLEDGRLAPGRYQRTFKPGGLSSGIYFFRISMGDFRDIGKMVLVK